MAIEALLLEQLNHRFAQAEAEIHVGLRLPP